MFQTLKCTFIDAVSPTLEGSLLKRELWNTLGNVRWGSERATNGKRVRTAFVAIFMLIRTAVDQIIPRPSLGLHNVMQCLRVLGPGEALRKPRDPPHPSSPSPALQPVPRVARRCAILHHCLQTYHRPYHLHGIRSPASNPQGSRQAADNDVSPWLSFTPSLPLWSIVTLP